MRKRESVDREVRKGPQLSVVTGTKVHRPEPVPSAAGYSDHIGGLLREMYDSTLKEPVPERFLALLRAMDAKSEDEAPGAAEAK
jgi:Anti-sigma factor NepR